MPESAIPAALPLLLGERNVAADTAITKALPDMPPRVQDAALDLLVERAHGPALTAVVCAYNEYEEHLQRLILEHIDGVRPGMRGAMGAAAFEDRVSAIEMITDAQDGKSAYLLTDALQHRCKQTRERAAIALNRMTDRLLERSAGPPGVDEVAGLAIQSDLLADALREGVMIWEIHRQPQVLDAALWMIGRLEPAIRTKLQDPHGRLGFMLLPVIAYAEDPRLAGAVLRALAIPQLRAAAAGAIGRADTPAFIRALLSECWLVADAQIERGCKWIRNAKWNGEWVEKLCRLDGHKVDQALHFLSVTGETDEKRMEIFRALLGGGRAELRQAVVWRLVQDPCAAATELLNTLASRRGDDTAVTAARECRRRNPPARKSGMAAEHADRTQTPIATGHDAFDRYFDSFDDPEPETGRTDLEAVLTAIPDVPARLRAKFRSPVAGERSRAIRVAAALKVIGEVDEDIYHLAYDADPTVRAVAVALLSRLPGPTAARILRSTLNDRDDRVQANTIEVLDEFGLGKRVDAVAEKLESSNSRVRANAIKALLGVELHAAAEALLDMLEDQSCAHRISALWVVERMRLRTVLHRIRELGRTDPDEHVRRRAGRILRELLSETELPQSASGALKARAVWAPSKVSLDG